MPEPLALAVLYFSGDYWHSGGSRETNLCAIPGTAPADHSTNGRANCFVCEKIGALGVEIAKLDHLRCRQVLCFASKSFNYNRRNCREVDFSMRDGDSHGSDRATKKLILRRLVRPG